MAITYTTASSSGTSQNPSITHGLTIEQGDLVVIIMHTNDDEVMLDSDGFTVDKRNVWTDVGGGNFSAQVFLLTKVAGASEPATYTFGMDAAADRYSIALYAIKGADTSNIFDGVVPTLTELSATTSPTSTGITTTNDNSLVISGFFYDSANAITYSAPTNSFTEDFDLSGSQAQAAFSRLQATAGAVGNMSATSSLSVAQASWMFAINEAAASGLTIDSTDASMQRNTDFQVVCSNATTPPTTGNTTLSNGNDTLTPSSVTGADPYTITFPVGDLTKQVDATGYDWTLEITP